MRSNRNRQGFSLIELLIVVAIILIIAAIAIPNLLRAKISANEASAVGSMRTLNTACVAYSSAWGVGYPATLARLKPGTPVTANAAGLIDSVLATGTKTGYKFTYISGAPIRGTVGSYTITGNPTTFNRTGTRYFFTDATGVIRSNFGAVATVMSKPI